MPDFNSFRVSPGTGQIITPVREPSGVAGARPSSTTTTPQVTTPAAITGPSPDPEIVRSLRTSIEGLQTAVHAAGSPLNLQTRVAEDGSVSYLLSYTERGLLPPPDAETPLPGSMRNRDGILEVHVGDTWNTLLTAQDIASGLLSFTRTETGAAARSFTTKLREVELSVGDFAGADPTGASNSGTAIQNCFNAAAERGMIAVIPEGIWRVNNPLTLPVGAAGLIMRGRIQYYGTGTALTIGSADGTARAQFKTYRGIEVARNTVSNWTNETDIGVVARNLDNCVLEIRRISGFTIGLRTLGEGPHGFEDSTVHLGQLVDNRYGLDIRTATPDSWNNAVRYFGGHFANSSSTHPTLSRFGVRLSRASGAYDLHNAHSFYSPGFELQRQGTPGAVDAIPFLVEVSGRALTVRNMRVEACSPFVARHTTAFNDALYEVIFIGTYGFTGGEIDYTSTATRAGGTVVPMHQSSSAIFSPRLVASAERVRSRAFRNVTVATDGVGFEQMAVLSGNPSGSPTNMNGFCFPGLALLTLNAEDVGLPTSRALVFVFDTTTCKEFFIAAEGTGLRPVVMQFDSNENVLGSSARVLFSAMNTVWVDSPTMWHEGNADLDTLIGDLPLNRLQRVRLHSTAAFAAIGVRGSSAVSVLKSLRIFTSAMHSPTLIYGGPRSWGEREITVTDSNWTVPALAAGATATRDVTVPGVRQGDFVQASFAKTTGFQNGGVVMHAVVGGTNSTNQVRVTAQNISGGSITVDTGVLHVRAVRPRV